MNETDQNNHGNELRWASGYARFMIRNRWAFMILVLICTIAGSLFVKDLNMRNDPDMKRANR